ncbi:enolase-phosphatase E1 isoform X4 [Diorhabda sublineata]|uniref:enolase-phosphatase E1 isoform X4 n=1 Tax=Diorhabda sublineata TaxID=1163346 RepID=UPI0024E138B7|nr:enolase-phosphatase E1 isoform X4 [Diorhabda sublineata]
MADTVKKSRIVSEEEENLEEALLEEFNMRLKNCMSKDDLQEADQYPEENFYENISNNIRPMSKIALISNDFIENERQHYYDTPAITFDIKNGDSSEDRNDIEEEPEHLYETLPEPTKTEMTDQNVEKTAPETLNLNLNPEIEMDFTDEYEMVENDKPTFSLNTTDFSDIKTQEDNVKSVKDRMLLTSDDAATLLFTQTVTSPMLTPSEENIDFLKGFQRENTETSEESNDSPPKEEEISNNDIDNVKENIYENLKQPMEENIYENLKDVKDKVEELEEEHIYQDIDDDPKDIYEPVDVPSKTNVEEDVMIENILYNEVDNEEEAKIIVTDLDASENSVNDYEFVSDSGTKLIEETVTIEESIEEFKKEENLVEYEESSFEDKIKETYTEFLYHSKTENNYYEKYAEVMSKNVKVNNREKDTETVPPEIVKNLKSQFQKGDGDVNANQKKEIEDASQLKMVNIIKQINKFELKDTQEDDDDDDSTVTETYTETTTIQSDVPEEKVLKKKKTKKSRKEEKENISVTNVEVVNEDYCYNVNVKNLRSKSMIDVLLSSNKKNIENVFSEVSVRALKEKFNIVENRDPLGIVKPSFKNMLPKSSFSKFDALQKKNVLHIRSSDSSKAQEKFNGTQIDTTNCKACSKQVFQMEQIKAEKAVWHKNCFRCTECSKQLTVETYVSHEGNLYCKPHFKSLFAPKVVEDDTPTRPRKPELIIRENQPVELPPDVVRASDKPDLGLEELQSLNVKERFQVFQQHQTETDSDRNLTPVNVKKSPSILSKLARFQAKGMDVGVTDEALNGIPIEESSTEEDEDEEDVPDGEDPTLYRAKKVQREKPFHFTNLNEVKNKWEQGEQTSRDERREERKQEIQSIRNKLFLGKQGKMKEAYQQAVMQSESCANLTKAEKIESCDTKSLKERFEKGELINDKEDRNGDTDETEVFQSEISKKSRSLFLELDANAAKQPQTIVTVPKVDVKKVREAYKKSVSEDIVRSSEVEETIEVKTADIQQRFKFFETYKEPEKQRKQFRITPPRDPSQVKNDTPDREIYHDPEIIRSNENVDDSEVAKASHTASKMLSKFREMEENRSKEPEAIGPKPLKRFTPPPEPVRSESESEEGSASEDENEEDEEYNQGDNQKLPEELIEAQKAARAKQLRAKFEKWEAQEIKREQNQAINIMEEYGDDSQIESTKSLTARFESMRETSSDKTRTPRVKVNRFVEISSVFEQCESCKEKVYPLEKISVHGHVYHKRCFKCMECSCVLRMDSYSYNKGLLYCTPHFKRLFISKGNYDTGFGFDQHKEKWNNVNATMA